MFAHKLKKLPKNSYEISVDIKWSEIEKELEKAFLELQNGLEVEGFRKGKVPKAVAEKHLKKDAVLSRAVQTLLPRIYDEIVKKEGLKPIISPRIELIKAKEKEDWQVLIKLAEKPEIVLGDYKLKIKNLKLKTKSDDIWLPGQDKTKPEVQGQEKKQKHLNEILTLLLKETKCDISDLVLEEELQSRLAQLVDDVRKIGLTVESYLKSKNLTMDELKARYQKEIAEMYQLEFILLDIADREKIQIEQAELNVLFESIKDEKERANVAQNSYFYASVLRKQKTLDFLTSL